MMKAKKYELQKTIHLLVAFGDITWKLSKHGFVISV